MKLSLTKMSIMIALIAAIAFPSCSKKNDDGNIGDKVKTAKFTITVTGGTAKNMTITVGGANTNGGTSTWKVNGAVMNDAAISFSQADFSTSPKTYIVELQQPANNVMLQITATSNNSSTYQIYYKCEINGANKDEATVDITAAGTFQKMLRYIE